MLHVEILHRNTKDLQPFIQLPFDLYKGDSNWAPPVRRKLLDSLLSDENDLLAHSQPQFFLAYQGGYAHRPCDGGDGYSPGRRGGLVQPV